MAAGYSDVLPKFKVIYGDPGNTTDTGTAGALRRAQMELERAEADDATTATRLQTLRGALAVAEQVDTAARAEYNAIAQGPIYQAAVAEWMAKAAVTNSLADYNAAVMKAEDLKTVVNRLDYEGYVPLANTILLDTLTDSNGTPNIASLRRYANLHDAGDTVATRNEETGVVSGTGNFDALGNLLVPLHDADSDSETPLTPRTDSRTVMQIRDRIEMATKTLADLKKAQADNLIGGLDDIYTEAVRRVQVETDHYDQQLRNALADDTNQNPFTVDNPNTPENEAAAYSIASRNAKYLSASNGAVHGGGGSPERCGGP